ncbi:MAG: hypothetical protein V3T17_14875 [Pseudomonadales bacterium]
MTLSYPKLPNYEFTWRSIQVEPIPLSGERITLGALVKGSDQALIAAKLIHAPKLKNIYSQEFGARIADALTVCIRAAEEFYNNKPLSSHWAPPLEGFFISKVFSSVAENIEEGLLRAAMHCSSFSVSLEAEKLLSVGKSDISAPESWRKKILEAVTIERANYAHYFDCKVSIRGSGVPLKFGFLSDNYAAQFDAISEVKSIQQSLVRAQSKLWQLDRLRDEGTLFRPDVCELLLRIPSSDTAEEKSAINEYIEELLYEASRRGLGIYTSTSPVDAAVHLIKNVA